MLGTVAHAQIVADGWLDESEWQQAHAQSCGAWQRTWPLALDAPRYGNSLRIVSTPAGLAAAFVIEQPRDEPRMKPRTPRDSESLIGDSISLMIDFDATSQVGYEFSVALGGGVRDGLITNQNRFDRDWDGEWSHAVRETDDQWIVELLIPWTTVNKRASDAAQRTIAVYATRFLFERNERFACPGIRSDAPAFLSDFHRVEIPEFRAAANFDFVPYGSVIFDQLQDRTDTKAGADISWKPTAGFWLTATLNPDFGQVESDELVVNFSAIETVFTDKRPFFTENHGIFDLRSPANGQLIYTRRIGAAPDDSSAGLADIDAALKLTGTVRSLNYGVFVAQEDDYDADFGRLFTAGRIALPFDHARVGITTTWTDRPLLDRDALLNTFDFELTPGERLRLAGQVSRSDIDVAESLAAPDAGYQVWLQGDFNRSEPINHTLRLLHIDDDFDSNDLGYMERNSLRHAEWETNRRVASAQENDRISGETQRLFLLYRENGAGERLQTRIQVSRDVQFRSAWRSYQELRYLPPAVDDVISRGNGPVRLDSRAGAYFDVNSRRLGDWQYLIGAYVNQQGVKDYSTRLQFNATWFPHEQLTLNVDVLPEWSGDWLLWEQDNLFGSYRAKRLDVDFRLDWIPTPKHELRLKWQWIGIDADPRTSWRTDVYGNLRRATDELAPFTVNNLGVQLRYRYELAPMSELFVVYARGGFDFLTDDPRNVGDLFLEQGDVRDADQFLIKFRYRL